MVKEHGDDAILAQARRIQGEAIEAKKLPIGYTCPRCGDVLGIRECKDGVGASYPERLLQEDCGNYLIKCPRCSWKKCFASPGRLVKFVNNNEGFGRVPTEPNSCIMLLQQKQKAASLDSFMGGANGKA